MIYPYKSECRRPRALGWNHPHADKLELFPLCYTSGRVVIYHFEEAVSMRLEIPSPAKGEARSREGLHVNLRPES